MSTLVDVASLEDNSTKGSLQKPKKKIVATLYEFTFTRDHKNLVNP